MKKRRIQEILLTMAKDVIPVSGSQHAAAVIYKGRIIAFGCNQYKTHPIMSLYGRNKKSIHLHAEIDAIQKAKKRVDVSKCTLYVVRVWKNGKAAYSKPCSGCERYIKDNGIKKVYHT